MHRINRLFFIGVAFFLAACGDWLRAPLPFPTPAQHDLVVLTTTGPLTYNVEDTGAANGLEHDLIEAFAQELGVGVKYIVAEPGEIAARLARGEAHIAIGWLPMPEEGQGKATPAIMQSHDVLVQNAASLPINAVDDLHGKTVHALAGSRQLASLKKLQKTIPDLTVVEEKEGDIFDLLETIDETRTHLAAIDSSLADIATQFTPSLQTSLALSEDAPVVWWLGSKPNDELFARVSSFVDRMQLDGTLGRLEDRYYGHVRRLKQADIIKFLGRTESVLPKLRKHFQAGQVVTGIDWRLLAAIAYQESQWEAEATSPTGVRGIMMLTEETADRLGVSNRLDPRESILAGARYLAMLKEQAAPEAAEPDRTWLALAAYNVGPGHFNAARTLARQLNADPGIWYDMKRILPLLAQPKYYQRLKSGRGRGGEAVILVENIRSYYDILVRNEEAFQPLSPRIEQMIGLRGKTTAPGIRP
ncbi:MAG: membrane-bound lytic murein transglycosylase MltF [Bacteroidota bacterium]